MYVEANSDVTATMLNATAAGEWVRAWASPDRTRRITPSVIPGPRAAGGRRDTPRRATNSATTAVSPYATTDSPVPRVRIRAPATIGPMVRARFIPMDCNGMALLRSCWGTEFAIIACDGGTLNEWAVPTAKPHANSTNGGVIPANTRIAVSTLTVTTADRPMRTTRRRS